VVLGRFGLDRLDKNHVTRCQHFAWIFRRRTDLRLLERLLRPFELIQGNAARRLVRESDAGAISVRARYQREPPAYFDRAGRQAPRGELGPPLGADINAAERAAVAMAAVVGDQSPPKCLVGETLQLGIKAHAHGKTGLVEILVAVTREQLAPNLFGEVV